MADELHAAAPEALPSPAADRTFRGPNYAPDLDRNRLSPQIERICVRMLCAGWQTFMEIRSALETMYLPSIFPEHSIWAQLRNRRKLGYDGCRRARNGGARCAGIWAYRHVPLEESAAG